MIPFKVKGQTLVEIVMLLPLLILTGVVLFEFIFLVRTQILLQYAASRTSLRLATGEKATLVLAEAKSRFLRNGRHWGSPGSFSSRNLASVPWRSYGQGASLPCRGGLISVDLTYHLFAHRLFRHFISPIVLGAHCEVPAEPHVPGEPNG